MEGGVLNFSQCFKGRTCGKSLVPGVEQAQRGGQPLILSSDSNLLGPRADLVTNRHYFSWFQKLAKLPFVSVPSFHLPFLLPLTYLWTIASVSCPHILLFSLCLSQACSQSDFLSFCLSVSRRNTGFLPNPTLYDMILKS